MQYVGLFLDILRWSLLKTRTAKNWALIIFFLFVVRLSGTLYDLLSHKRLSDIYVLFNVHYRLYFYMRLLIPQALRMVATAVPRVDERLKYKIGILLFNLPFLVPGSEPA